LCPSLAISEACAGRGFILPYEKGPITFIRSHTDTPTTPGIYKYSEVGLTRTEKKRDFCLICRKPFDGEDFHHI